MPATILKLAAPPKGPMRRFDWFASLATSELLIIKSLECP